MCKKYNVLDARKRVFFIVMELLEKAGGKRPAGAAPSGKKAGRKAGMKNHFVHTPCGPVQGAAGGADGVSVFRGIRYATAGRWEYPRQVTHWDGVYDAANFGACSFQPRAFYNEEDVPEKAFYYNEFRRGEHYDYSEDCLFLNIWAPDDAKNAPVLFYIHGGGFLGGCGHEKHFDGTAWCKKGVVAVTINYRLGPMGFLCLPELAARDGHTGNYANV